MGNAAYPADAAVAKLCSTVAAAAVCETAADAEYSKPAVKQHDAGSTASDAVSRWEHRRATHGAHGQ